MFSYVSVGCSAEDLKQWVEAKGYRVLSVKLIRDLVSGTSPSFAHVWLVDTAEIDEAARILNDQPLRGSNIRVSRVVPARSMVERGRAMGAAG